MSMDAHVKPPACPRWPLEQTGGKVRQPATRSCAARLANGDQRADINGTRWAGTSVSRRSCHSDTSPGGTSGERESHQTDSGTRQVLTGLPVTSLEILARIWRGPPDPAGRGCSQPDRRRTPRTHHCWSEALMCCSVRAPPARLVLHLNQRTVAVSCWFLPRSRSRGGGVGAMRLDEPTPTFGVTEPPVAK